MQFFARMYNSPSTGSMDNCGITAAVLDGDGSAISIAVEIYIRCVNNPQSNKVWYCLYMLTHFHSCLRLEYWHSRCLGFQCQFGNWIWCMKMMQLIHITDEIMFNIIIIYLYLQPFGAGMVAWTIPFLLWTLVPGWRLDLLHKNIKNICVCNPQF